MKTILFTLALGLTLSGNAFACEKCDGPCPDHAKSAASDTGEKCADRKDSNQPNISASDAMLARQAAASLLTIDAPRPDGKITADLQTSLDQGAIDIAKSVKAGKANSTCCNGEASDCCKGAGKACCGTKQGVKNVKTNSNAFDGATKTVEGICPEHKG